MAQHTDQGGVVAARCGLGVVTALASALPLAAQQASLAYTLKKGGFPAGTDLPSQADAQREILIVVVQPSGR